MCLYLTRIDGNQTMKTSYIVCSFCKLTRGLFSRQSASYTPGDKFWFSFLLSHLSTMWTKTAQSKKPALVSLAFEKLVTWELNPFNFSYVNVFVDRWQSDFSLNIPLVLISSSACWQITDWSVEIVSEKISYASQPTTNNWWFSQWRHQIAKSK